MQQDLASTWDLSIAVTGTHRRQGRRRVGEDNVIVRSAAAINASAYTARMESDNIAPFQSTSHSQRHPRLDFNVTESAVEYINSSNAVTVTGNHLVVIRSPERICNSYCVSSFMTLRHVGADSSRFRILFFLSSLVPSMSSTEIALLSGEQPDSRTYIQGTAKQWNNRRRLCEYTLKQRLFRMVGRDPLYWRVLLSTASRR